MDTNQFIDDLNKAISNYKGTASGFAREAGIDPAYLAKMRRRTRPVSFAKAIALWPLIYGADFPEIPDRARAKVNG